MAPRCSRHNDCLKHETPLSLERPNENSCAFLPSQERARSRFRTRCNRVGSGSSTPPCELLSRSSFDFPRALEVTVVRCQSDNRVVNQVQKMKALLLRAGYNVSNEISSKFGGQLSTRLGAKQHSPTRFLISIVRRSAAACLRRDDYSRRLSSGPRASATKCLAQIALSWREGCLVICHHLFCSCAPPASFQCAGQSIVIAT